MSDEQGHPARMPDPGTPFPIVQPGQGIKLERQPGDNKLTLKAPNGDSKSYELGNRARRDAVWLVLTGGSTNEGSFVDAVNQLAWVYDSAPSGSPYTGLLTVTATVTNNQGTHWGYLEQKATIGGTPPTAQIVMFGRLMGETGISGTFNMDTAMTNTPFLLAMKGLHDAWVDNPTRPGNLDLGQVVVGMHGEPTATWGEHVGNSTQPTWWGVNWVTNRLTLGLQLPAG
jgi:hypothetical protein